MWQIHSIQNSILYSATHILYQKESSKAWLVDCGDIEPIFSFLNIHNLSVVGVLLTHTHYDHLYGLNELLLLFPDIVIYTNHLGKEALYNDILNLSMCYDEEFIYQGDKVIELTDKQIVHIGIQSCVAYETPGHDLTCLSYQIERFLFTGDSYIPGHNVVVCWRNSNKEDAQKSVDRIMKLAKGMIIVPGHIL